MGAFEVSPDVAKAGCKFLASRRRGTSPPRRRAAAPLIPPYPRSPHTSRHSPAGARRLRRRCERKRSRRVRRIGAAGKRPRSASSAASRHSRHRRKPAALTPPLPHRRPRSLPPPSPLQPSVAAEAIKALRTSSCSRRHGRPPARRRQRPSRRLERRSSRGRRQARAAPHARRRRPSNPASSARCGAPRATRTSSIVTEEKGARGDHRQRHRAQDDRGQCGRRGRLAPRRVKASQYVGRRRAPLSLVPNPVPLPRRSDSVAPLRPARPRSL